MSECKENHWTKTKLIKDPLHGYIRVPTVYMKHVVDTCEFQRLRNIRQTSYDSLYPGSSHNRFIHSLGVFHLGHKAYEAFRYNACELNCGFEQEPWDELKITFELACLLHDVGHTPFSHSGEDFLLIAESEDTFEFMNPKVGCSDKRNAAKLYNDLLDTMKTRLEKDRFQHFLEDFSASISGSRNFDGESSAPKAHEIMSVIIALEVYGDFLRDMYVDLDLFSRAILGVQYKGKIKRTASVKNVLIQLLNSSIIDVDRLDYVMRDTKMSGFDNIAIDVDRLLDSVTIVKEEDAYALAYKKNALSTIENVVLAHDAERRWIQNHPIILYDSYLVKAILKLIQDTFEIVGSDQGIFQKDAFKADGIKTSGGNRIRLLNDGDCIFLMKQMEDQENLAYVKEYLSRDERKHPIWKSESEFRLLLQELTASQKEEFLGVFAAKNEEKYNSSIGSILNSKRVKEIEQQIKQIRQDDALPEEDQQNLILFKRKQLLWLKELKKFCKSIGISFELHNMTYEPFKSGINKLSKGVKIWFGNFEKKQMLHHALNVYQTSAFPNQEIPKKIEPVIYWYIYKSDQFKMNEFVNFIKATAKKCESLK